MMLDRVAAAVLALPAAGLLANHADGPTAVAVAVAALGLFTAPILVHRTRPLLALGLVLAGLGLVAVADPTAVAVGLVAFAWLLHPLAGDDRPPVAFGSLALALACAAATALPDFERRGGAVVFALLYLGVWTAGFAMGAHRRQTAQAGAAAVAEERLRIARDLHDLVAHGLSVITVQAGFGALVAADRPLEARDALAAIETTGRQTLVELRGLLDVLRVDTEIDLSPAPGFADLGALAERTAEAGIEVDLDLDLSSEGLPPGLELAAYRIVQEALTNVVRHAGAGRARVQLVRTDGAIRLEITDDGRGGTPRPGHGLTGMRERARFYGGTFEAAPLPGGGFRVAVALPAAAPQRAA